MSTVKTNDPSDIVYYSSMANMGFCAPVLKDNSKPENNDKKSKDYNPRLYKMNQLTGLPVTMGNGSAIPIEDFFKFKLRQPDVAKGYESIFIITKETEPRLVRAAKELMEEPSAPVWTEGDFIKGKSKEQHELWLQLQASEKKQEDTHKEFAIASVGLNEATGKIAALEKELKKLRK